MIIDIEMRLTWVSKSEDHLERGQNTNLCIVRHFQNLWNLKIFTEWFEKDIHYLRMVTVVWISFKSETVDEKPRPKKNRFQDRKADWESEVKSG